MHDTRPSAPLTEELQPLPEELRRVIAMLSLVARRRQFGVSDPRANQRIRHGYLLALEEVERVYGEAEA